MDKKPEKLVPEVRFKGFTDDWEQRKLGDEYKHIGNAFVGTASPYYTQNGYFYLESNNIKNGQINHDHEVFINESFYHKQLNKLLHTGDLVMVQSGHVGDTAVITEKYNGTAAHALIMFRKPQNNMLSFFLNSFFQSSNAKNRIDVLAIGNTIRHILASDMKKFVVYLPDNKEKVEVAELFLELQKLISLQQRKLKQLERLKTAMLQQLLANQRFPKVRFNDFKDSWKDYRLGEVFDEFSVKSKRENEYKLLSSTTSGMESRSGRVSGHSNIGYKVIDNGDIVLSPQNLWLGNINLNNMGKGIVSPSYHTFKIVNANPIFVNFQLKTEKMLFEYKMVSVQGASVVRRNLDMDAFKKIVIKIPNEKEQIKIASLFSSISNIINNHQNKLTQLSTLKKYLLQKMFI